MSSWLKLKESLHARTNDRTIASVAEVAGVDRVPALNRHMPGMSP